MLSQTRMLRRTPVELRSGDLFVGSTAPNDIQAKGMAKNKRLRKYLIQYGKDKDGSVIAASWEPTSCVNRQPHTVWKGSKSREEKAVVMEGFRINPTVANHYASRPVLVDKPGSVISPVNPDTGLRRSDRLKARTLGVANSLCKKTARLKIARDAISANGCVGLRCLARCGGYLPPSRVLAEEAHTVSFIHTRNLRTELVSRMQCQLVERVRPLAFMGPARVPIPRASGPVTNNHQEDQRNDLNTLRTLRRSSRKKGLETTQAADAEVLSSGSMATCTHFTYFAHTSTVTGQPTHTQQHTTPSKNWSRNLSNRNHNCNRIPDIHRTQSMARRKRPVPGQSSFYIEDISGDQVDNNYPSNSGSNDPGFDFSFNSFSNVYDLLTNSSTAPVTRNPPPINAGPDGLNEVASLIQNPPWLARQSRPRLEGISNDVSDSQDNPVDEDYLPTGAEPKFRVPNRGRKIDPNSPAYRSRRHVCEQCDERFERSEHLLRHINTIHLKKREYICDLCIPNKTFSRSDNLLQHKAQKHKLGKARNRRVSKKIKVEDEEDSHGEISDGDPPDFTTAHNGFLSDNDRLTNAVTNLSMRQDDEGRESSSTNVQHSVELYADILIHASGEFEEDEDDEPPPRRRRKRQFLHTPSTTVSPLESCDITVKQLTITPSAKMRLFNSFEPVITGEFEAELCWEEETPPKTRARTAFGTGEKFKPGKPGEQGRLELEMRDAFRNRNDIRKVTPPERTAYRRGESEGPEATSQRVTITEEQVRDLDKTIDIGKVVRQSKNEETLKRKLTNAKWLVQDYREYLINELKLMRRELQRNCNYCNTLDAIKDSGYDPDAFYYVGNLEDNDQWVTRAFNWSEDYVSNMFRPSLVRAILRLKAVINKVKFLTAEAKKVVIALTATTKA